MITRLSLLQLPLLTIDIATKRVYFREPERLATQPPLGHRQKIKRLSIAAQPRLRFGQVKVAVWIGRVDDNGFFQAIECPSWFASVDQLATLIGQP